MSWITEHLTENDEIRDAAIRWDEERTEGEHLPETRPFTADERWALFGISEAEWTAAMEAFDRAQACEDDEDYTGDLDHRDGVESSLYRGPL